MESMLRSTRVSCEYIDGVMRTLLFNNYVIDRLASKQLEITAPGDTYFILLILTDGKISDMPQTLEAIVKVNSRLYGLSSCTLTELYLYFIVIY